MSSDGQDLLRVPLVRADCEQDFRQKFGRRMTEVERNFLRMGNEALDRMDEEIPENSICVRTIERALRSCDCSRGAIERATRIAEKSKALIKDTCSLLCQASEVRRQRPKMKKGA